MDVTAAIPLDHVTEKWFNENKCNRMEPFRLNGIPLNVCLCLENDWNYPTDDNSFNQCACQMELCYIHIVFGQQLTQQNEACMTFWKIITNDVSH